ncbi:hypothetical protein [Streptomyces sp. 8L]|nr:hypothetical protein [Streptomyces sp. 8L]
MAVVTTAMAGPLLRALYPARLVTTDRSRAAEPVPVRTPVRT